MSAALHGGDVYGLARELGIAERKVMDFSASINPLGLSPKIKAEMRTYLKFLPNYPDPACTRLVKHLSKHLTVGEENLIAGNGSTELIYLVVRAFKPSSALVVAPAFSEYERALRVNGVEDVHFLSLSEDKGFALDPVEFAHSMKGRSMAFLCNPDNPTARTLERDTLTYLAAEARKVNCLLVVDEAFVDFVPEVSIATGPVDNPMLIVLRSLTKFYAMSGIRLGMAIVHGSHRETLLKYKEPWSVNTLAQRAGVVAINDTHYAGETFKCLKLQKSSMESWLRRNGIFFYPSKINFYLVRDGRCPKFYRQLSKKGILLRDCSNYRGLDNRFLRIAVKSHRENRALFRAMAYLLQN
ncbi:MAG: threonine-phosphate decarboxylase [Nitrospirae bacterium]|nr:threonine-phosphate decarboxylase [Nitrospirota bacterium]